MQSDSAAPERVDDVNAIIGAVDAPSNSTPPSKESVMSAIAAGLSKRPFAAVSLPPGVQFICEDARIPQQPASVRAPPGARAAGAPASAAHGGDSAPECGVRTSALYISPALFEPFAQTTDTSSRRAARQEAQRVRSRAAPPKPAAGSSAWDGGVKDVTGALTARTTIAGIGTYTVADGPVVVVSERVPTKLLRAKDVQLAKDRWDGGEGGGAGEDAVEAQRDASAEVLASLMPLAKRSRPSLKELHAGGVASLLRFGPLLLPKGLFPSLFWAVPPPGVKGQSSLHTIVAGAEIDPPGPTTVTTDVANAVFEDDCDISALCAAQILAVGSAIIIPPEARVLLGGKMRVRRARDPFVGVAFTTSPSVFASAGGVDVGSVSCFGWSHVFAVPPPSQMEDASLPPHSKRAPHPERAATGNFFDIRVDPLTEVSEAAAVLLRTDVADAADRITGGHTSAPSGATGAATATAAALPTAPKPSAGVSDEVASKARADVERIIRSAPHSTAAAVYALQHISSPTGPFASALKMCLKSPPRNVRSLFDMRREYLLGNLCT